MKQEPGRSPLPPEIEVVVGRVLQASGLAFVDGRAEVEAELRAHFEDGLSGGASAESLLLKFGDPEAAGRRIARTRPRAAARNRGERGRWGMSMAEWWNEIRSAARRLLRTPGFSMIVIVTLALGVGANTAIFTVLNAVLLEDLPYQDPDRLVRVYESHVEQPSLKMFMRVPVFREYRQWDDVFESLSVIYTYREVGADLTDGDVPRRVTMLRVSAGYFETLGVAPQRGRTFLEEESFGPGESLGSTDIVAAVAIISDRLWTEHFGRDPGIVGRMVQLDGASFEVVGVLPSGFTNPIGPQGDVWIPQDTRLGGSNNFGNFYLSGVGRLRDGVTLEAARERVKVRAAAFGQSDAAARSQFPHLFPLQDDVVGAARTRMLWILAAAAVLVLLTACVNVANLLYARGLGQDRQLAIRSALGSGRGRLVAGILSEYGLLALLGGAMGLAVGWTVLNGLVRLAPDALPSVVELEMGLPVFAFALALTALALLTFGLTPALRMSRTSPADVLRSGDRASTAGRFARRVRDGLVMGQVAAALILVASATLLARSFGALGDVALGVEPEGVLTYEVHLPTARYPDGPARHAFHEQLQERVRQLPGVEAVGATSWLPVNGRYHEWGFQWDPEEAVGSPEAPWNPSEVRIIAGDYFATLGIDLLRGRAPAGVDFEAEPVMWVNEKIQEEIFGATEAVGQQVWMGGALRRVVGVVESIPYGARGEVLSRLYLPHAQYNGDRNWALIQTVRARSDLSDLRTAIREELSGLDGQLIFYRPQSFEDVLGTIRAQDRFATLLMAAFAGLALLLALLGTYGILSGSVASRTREIGIRMALGADSGRLRTMVLRYAATITLSGVVLGLFGAWISGRWIEALLFGVEAGDPLTLAASVTIFLLVGVVSGWLPAARATRVDTMETLSTE